MPRRRVLNWVPGVIGCVFAVQATCPRADELPEQTIRVVVPVSAGETASTRAPA